MRRQSPSHGSFDSRDSSPKRKRPSNGYHPDRYSSPDELAASPADGPSPSAMFRIAERPRTRRSLGLAGPSRVSGDEEDSPDELDHTFYRYDKARARQATTQTNTPAETAPSPEPVIKDEPDTESPREGPPSPSPVDNQPRRLNFKPRLVLRGHKKGVSAVKYSPDGKLIASCSADATIKIWDAETGKVQHTFEGHLAGISTVVWSPDSRLLASGSDDKSIRIWDVVARKPHPIPFLGHHNYIYSLAFSPKGNMLVSGSYDEAVFIWDVRTARVMRSLPAHSDPVGGVDFVRDGTLVVSCSGDGLIRIWDTMTGQCLRTLVHEDTPPVASVRFAPNGKYVLAWTLDNNVRLWNYVEGRVVKTYQGHKNQTYGIGGAFGTYGDAPWAFIASASEDGDLYLWDVNSKEILQVIKGHEGVSLGVDVHPTEKALVSCGLDKTVRIWMLDPDAPFTTEVKDSEALPDAADDAET